MNFNDLQLFFCVLRKRSFLAASKEMGIPHSTISRRIQNLEEELGVQLLHRTTRKVTPSELGQELYASCHDLLAEFMFRANSVLENTENVVRNYKVSMPSRAGLDYLANWVTDFSSQRNNLRLEIELSNANKNLIEEQIDLAFRVGPLVDSNNRAQFLWDIPYGLFANKHFIRKHSIEKDNFDIEQIGSIPCIGFKPVSHWIFRKGKKDVVQTPNVTIKYDDFRLCLEAAEMGLGVCYIPEAMSTKLIKLRPKGASCRTRKMYAYYPNEQHTSETTRALIEYVKKRYAAL